MYKFCPNCGRKNEGWRFCPDCGRSLNDQIITPEITERNGCDMISVSAIQKKMVGDESVDESLKFLFIKNGILVKCRDNTVKHVFIPDSVKSIGEEVFCNCDRLTDIILPNTVVSIGYGAFSGCSNLQKIQIPNSVIVIEPCAFSDCESLASVNS